MNVRKFGKVFNTNFEVQYVIFNINFEKVNLPKIFLPDSRKIDCACGGRAPC